MSLLNGMNDMLVNHEAMESVNDAELFEDYLAMEADELIDVMVDGEDEFDDDEFDDDEFDDDEFGEDDIANEKVLTGANFLASLVHGDDPIKTKPGSLGPKTSAATFNTNFSNGAKNTTDSQKTKNGAIGSEKNTAAFSKNYSHTSSNSAVESALFFGDLMGDDYAMEGVIGNIKEKVAAKKNAQRQEKCKAAGINDIDKAKLQSLIDENKFDEAIKMVTSYGKYLESAKGKFPEDDPEAVKKCKIIDRMLKTNTSLMMKLIEDKKTKGYIESGMDAKSARKKARNESKSKARNSESKAMEAYLNECIEMMTAFEAEGRASLSDTSVGDNNGTASPENNFSDGLVDDNDPQKTKNGSIGSDDNVASFDENFSDIDLNSKDEFASTHGSIGSKDVSAKDPSLESTLDDELAFLNDVLFDDSEEEFGN